MGYSGQIGDISGQVSKGIKEVIKLENNFKKYIVENG